MAKSLAKSLGCSFQRIQFTPDLLPSDITGITFFNQNWVNLNFDRAVALANRASRRD